MKKPLILFVALLILSDISAQVARGRVFADGNRNGTYDKGETGIPNVAVSNGIDVVLTNKEGDYLINAPENCIVFVIKPAAYQYAVNEVNLPMFYYKNYPHGGPKLANPVTSPTGTLPDKVNFPLIPSQQQDTFKAVIFGDTQIRSLEELDFLSRDIVAPLAGDHGFTFGAILGDLVHDDFHLYSPLNQVMAALNIPLYNAQGNHDMNFDVANDSLATESFKLVYGPKNYAYNYGNVHFIVLDDIIYTGENSSRPGYVEGFSNDAIHFVTNDLKYVPTDHLIVLMMHAPFISSNTKKPIVNLEKILGELSRFPHTFSISGHNHSVSQQLLGKESGWNGVALHHHFNAGTVCGNWWNGLFDEQGIPDATMHDGTPNGYAVLSFSGNSYSVDYEVARRQADYHMNIFSPSVITQITGLRDRKELFVNFFTGSERDVVSVRFDDQPEIIMNRTIQPDPAYVYLFELWNNPLINVFGRKPSQPQDCLHLWKATFPASLTVGMHKAEVTATDLFGRKFTAYQFFRVGE